MRTILIILISLISITGFSQTDSDLQTSYLLTKDEAKTLNSIFSTERKDFDFNGKLVGFTVGITGTQVENKMVFFEKFVNPLLHEQDKSVCSMIVLTKDEKSKSGGFDAVVMAPAKIFTQKHREELINELNKISEYLRRREN